MVLESPWTQFLIFEEEGEGTGADQELGRGVVWNDAVLVMIFYIAEEKLDCAPVGLSLGIFSRAKTEEQGNMNKVSIALGEMAGRVG